MYFLQRLLALVCPHFLPGPLRTSAFSTCLQAWVSSTVLCAAPQGHGVQLPPPSLPASSRCWSWSCWSQSFPAPDKRSQRPWHSSPPLCACQALLVSRTCHCVHLNLPSFSLHACVCLLLCVFITAVLTYYKAVPRYLLQKKLSSWRE